MCMQATVKHMARISSVLIGLLAVGFTLVYGSAQAQPDFLKLRGVGISSEVPPNGFATDVQVVASYAYVAWGSGDTNYHGSLEIFDVANPSKPVRLGGYKSRMPPNAVHVAGRFAYLAAGVAQNLRNRPGALEIVDVSDPVNPRLVSEIATAGAANA